MCLPFEDLAKRTLGKGEHLGFEWEITKNRWAQRCGYVRVLPGHPWFGKTPDVAVHGGITFAEHGKACPTHGEADEWWIGFDCGHGGDACDMELLDTADQEAVSFVESINRIRGSYPLRVWTQADVEALCKSVAEQAASALLLG